MSFKQFLTCILCFTTFLVAAQQHNLSGEVIDTAGNPVFDANILIDGNIRKNISPDGTFKIDLPNRPHKIIVSAKGFVPKSIVLPYNYAEQQTIILDAAQVTTNFTANEIIRRVRLRLDSLQQYATEYTSDIYKINKAYVNNIPFEIWPVSGKLIPDNSDTGLVYLSEEYQKAIYVNNRRYLEETVGKRAAGRLPVRDWNHLPDYDLSLYNQKIYMREVFSRGFYSPLSDVALRFYNFSIAADYQLGTEHIYIINFTPRKKKFPVYNGTLKISDNGYKILASDFIISSNNQLELFDSVIVHQEYENLSNIYTLHYQKVEYHISLVRFRGTYESELYYKNFTFKPAEELLPILQKNYRGSINDSAYYVPGNFWDTLRGRPLSRGELSYLKQHDIANYFMGNYELKDSVPFLDHRFKPLPYVASGFKYGNNKIYIDWDPPWYAIGYNTIEGPYLRYRTPIQFLRDSSTITINPELRYGFVDNRLKYQISTDYFYDLLKPKRLGISAGSIVSQFNKNTPILPLINTFYTLGLGRNFLKLYQRDFVTIDHDWEIVNGLTLNTALDFSRRSPLYNNTDFTLIESLEDFTPNNPIIPGAPINNYGFETHNAITLNVGMNYTIGQPYRYDFGKKKVLQAKRPMVYFNMDAGIPSGISKTNYLFLSVGVRGSLAIGNAGRSSFDVNVGGFAVKQYIPFMDYRHFDGVQTLFLQAPPNRISDIRQFSTLPYYDFSTTHNYLEAHYEHQFDGSLLANIAFMRKLKIHSFTGVNYLAIGDGNHFTEYFLGFDNIFGALRLEFAGGLDSFRELHPSLRVGIDVDYTYYANNRRR